MSLERQMLKPWYGKRHCGGDDGQAVAEMAIMAPMLLGLMLAIYQCGIAFSNQLLLTQAVDASTRQLQQIRLTTKDPCADAFKAMTNAAPSLVPSQITLTLTMNGNPGVSGTTCSGDQTQLVQGGSAEVQATYPYSLSFLGLTAASGKFTAVSTELEY